MSAAAVVRLTSRELGILVRHASRPDWPAAMVDAVRTMLARARETPLRDALYPLPFSGCNCAPCNVVRRFIEET